MYHIQLQMLLSESQLSKLINELSRDNRFSANGSPLIN